MCNQTTQQLLSSDYLKIISYDQFNNNTLITN